MSSYISYGFLLGRLQVEPLLGLLTASISLQFHFTIGSGPLGVVLLGV